MSRDPFEHRKYHAMYFILGILIAVILVTMLSGCEKGKTDKGRDCIGFAGMTVEGEQCEVIDFPPTDPPGCWYPDAPPEYCEPEPRNCCLALIPECMACADDCSVDEWIEKTCGSDAIDAEYAGWDPVKNEPIWLCQAIIVN